MRKNSLTKTNTGKLEYIIALCFIVPYMEIEKIRNLIGYKKNGIVIPSSIFIMLFITIIMTVVISFFRRQRFSNQIVKIVHIKIILDTFIFIRGLFIDNIPMFFVQFLWFTIPFYYAVSIIKFIDYFGLKAYNVGKVGLLYFTLYLCINIIINFQKYDFSLHGILVQSRLISLGGGPVILGYTIALMMCYLLIIRHNISQMRAFITISILFCGAILTGSRGAIWPIIFLIFLYAITNKTANVQILSTILLIILIIIANPISFLSKMVPRIMNLSDEARIQTVVNSLRVFNSEPIINKFFGTGLSKCFPYQIWLYNWEDVMNLLSYNTFLYNGHVLLVQPHNSYIYILLEAGLIGLAIFLTIFIRAFKIVKSQSCNNKKYKYLMLLLILFLNCFDSVFIMQPGSAGLWWLLLFITLYDESKVYNTSEVSSKFRINLITKREAFNN